jgi:hypothetical protein
VGCFITLQQPCCCVRVFLFGRQVLSVTVSMCPAGVGPLHVIDELSCSLCAPQLCWCIAFFRRALGTPTHARLLVHTQLVCRHRCVLL